MSSIMSRIEAPGPKRALALSGGGTLGVIEIAFLEKIEAVLRDRFRKPDLRLCEYFDLFGGTSTGAHRDRACAWEERRRREGLLLRDGAQGL